MEGGLKDLQAMVLQDQLACCIVLSPVRHLSEQHTTASDRQVAHQHADLPRIKMTPE